jgi:hypothetical protein
MGRHDAGEAEAEGAAGDDVMAMCFHGLFLFLGCVLKDGKVPTSRT